MRPLKGFWARRRTPATVVGTLVGDDVPYPIGYLVGECIACESPVVVNVDTPRVARVLCPPCVRTRRAVYLAELDELRRSRSAAAPAAPTVKAARRPIVKGQGPPARVRVRRMGRAKARTRRMLRRRIVEGRKVLDAMTREALDTTAQREELARRWQAYDDGEAELLRDLMIRDVRVLYPKASPASLRRIADALGPKGERP